jgi:flagellar protein FlbD
MKFAQQNPERKSGRHRLAPKNRYGNCNPKEQMIYLTRLDNSELLVNALLIERVEAMPDTVVTLTTGRKILVREPPEEVVEKTVAYLRGLRGSDGDAEAVINIAQAGRVIK